MLASINDLKKSVINEFTAFAKDPAKRTADVLPSLQVLTAQLLAYTHLSEEERIVYLMPEK